MLKAKYQVPRGFFRPEFINRYAVMAFFFKKNTLHFTDLF